MKGPYQCWAGIDKKHTRGYGYLSNQERPDGYGHGYDMCSGILARVEFNTRAMPAEAHGAYTHARIHTRWYFSVKQYPWGALKRITGIYCQQYPLGTPRVLLTENTREAH